DPARKRADDRRLRADPGSRAGRADPRAAARTHAPSARESGGEGGEGPGAFPSRSHRRLRHGRRIRPLRAGRGRHGLDFLIRRARMIEDRPTQPRRPHATRRRPKDVIGIVRRKREGYGFLSRLDGEGEDLFLPPYEAQHLMDGDRVRVRIVPGRYGRDVAEVVEILEHVRRQLLGAYRSRRKIAWIEPLDPMLPERIPVPLRREIADG